MSHCHMMPHRTTRKVTEEWWTTKMVAAHHGYTPQRATVIAKNRGIGQKVDDAWLFHWPEDVEAMAPRPPGRPRKGKR